MNDIQTFTLPAGTVVHRNGVPVILMTNTLIGTSPKNRPHFKNAKFVGEAIFWDWSDSSTSDNNPGKQD